jgi:hypothetical protein
MIAGLILSLLSTLATATADRPAPADRLTVYVFTTTDCPIANRYAPEIQRLAARYQQFAHFVLVYPVPADTQELINEHQKKYAYVLDSIRDTDQKLVKMTGVTISPEVAVMRGTRVLYRGRIDDRYIELGKDRPSPTRRDLEAALDLITTGRPVVVKQTRAVGCFLADLMK